MGSDSLCVVAKVGGVERVWKKIFKKPDEGIILRIRGILEEERNKNEKNKLLEYLNMLTDDVLDMVPTGDLRERTTSYVIIKEEREIEHRPLGTKLIRDLIQQNCRTKTVKIEAFFESSEGSSTRPTNNKDWRNSGKIEDWEKAQNPEEGADAFIEINMEKEFDVPIIDSENYFDWNFMPFHIVLAHELIHAYHMVNGISKEGIKDYEYRCRTGWIVEERVKTEELYTIGIDRYKNEDITENKIREEQNKIIEEQQLKLNRRIAYKNPKGPGMTQ